VDQLVVEVEQVDFELVHHFQFVEQRLIQLQWEQVEQELLVEEQLLVQEIHQYFQQLHQQVVEEVLLEI
jgi:hypothetical protein